MPVEAADRYKWLLSALYWLASGPIEIVRQLGVGSGSDSSGGGQGSGGQGCCVIQDLLLSCLPSPDINIGPKPGQLLSFQLLTHYSASQILLLLLLFLLVLLLALLLLLLLLLLMYVLCGHCRETYYSVGVCPLVSKGSYGQPTPTTFHCQNLTLLTTYSYCFCSYCFCSYCFCSYCICSYCFCSYCFC